MARGEVPVELGAVAASQGSNYRGSSRRAAGTVALAILAVAAVCFVALSQPSSANTLYVACQVSNPSFASPAITATVCPRSVCCHAMSPKTTPACATCVTSRMKSVRCAPTCVLSYCRPSHLLTHWQILCRLKYSSFSSNQVSLVLLALWALAVIVATKATPAPPERAARPARTD